VPGVKNFDFRFSCLPLGEPVSDAASRPRRSESRPASRPRPSTQIFCLCLTPVRGSVLPNVNLTRRATIGYHRAAYGRLELVRGGLLTFREKPTPYVRPPLRKAPHPVILPKASNPTRGGDLGRIILVIIGKEFPLRGAWVVMARD